MNHSTLIFLAQVLKILAGVAQLGFGIWLVLRGPRSTLTTSFALYFGANGIAYVFFNIAMPGQRTPKSLAVQGWAAFNWIATIAVVVFASSLIRNARHRKLTTLAGVSVGGIVLAAELLSSHQSFVQFGGTAIYASTALVLGALPILFMTESGMAQATAWLGAALAINSVDHLGAGVITRSAPWLMQVAAMGIVLALWIIAAFTRKEANWKPMFLVVACLIVPFLAGALVTEAAGSYVGMQRSGFIGIGRLVATALLAYSTARARLFSCSQQPVRAANASA